MFNMGSCLLNTSQRCGNGLYEIGKCASSFMSSAHVDRHTNLCDLNLLDVI